jgi:hypothetical protein
MIINKATSRVRPRLVARKAPMSNPHLPEAIVAAGNALVSELSTWAVAHPDTSLAEQETAVLTMVRQALPALLHGVLQTTLRALTSQPVRCPTCQHRALSHDWRRRQVLTTCGPLLWERPWATCPACGRTFGAGDAPLGVTPRTQHSAGVTALLVTLGSATAFREAAQLLQQTTGLVVSSETVRRVSEAAGTALADADDTAVAAAAAGAEPAVVDAAPGLLVAETDGVLVRYRDAWHEVKIGAMGGWVVGKDGQGRLTALSYVAAREPSTAFADRFSAEVARRGGLAVTGWHGPHQGVAEFRRLVVLGDGALWIWVTVASQCGTVTEIVDYFHAAEHLTTVAGLLHGGGSAAATAWAAAQRAVLRTDGVDAVLPALCPPAGLSAEAAAKLATERGYFTSNAARMQYPTFEAQGLPIGSGAVESSAKHLIQLRLKRPGARWSTAGGRAVITLRAHHATSNRAAA